MNIAIIPARGGSKRIPRKNIKPFCGRPMINWSIETALASRCFEKIIVSTDCEEIAKVAVNAGAEVPFYRPPELSGDFVTTTPVVAHAISWCIENLATPDYVCCLYATAPFIRSQDLVSGLNALRNENCDFAFSVTRFSYPIQRAIRVTESGRVEMFDQSRIHSRSQDLEDAYHDAGQFYWGKTSAWLENISVFSSNSLPIVLPRERVQDIDTMEDWELAEALYSLHRSKSNAHA